MVTLVTIAAFGLLVAGIVGSAIPKVPGPLISLGGVYTYWWGTGYAEPSTLLLGILTVLGVLTVLGGFAEEIIAARMGGASTRNATIAGAVGFVCFLALGPIAMLVGTAIAVFILEYRRQHDAKAGATAALAVVLATIGSTVVQILLTAMILLTMVGVVVF